MENDDILVSIKTGEVIGISCQYIFPAFSCFDSPWSDNVYKSAKSEGNCGAYHVKPMTRSLYLKGHWYFLPIYKVTMKHNMKHFSSCIFLTDWKLLGVYHTIKSVGFQNNKLRVAVHFTSYELLFSCELRVTVYCTGYELLFACELRVTICCLSDCDRHFTCESRQPLIYFKYWQY